MRLVIAATAAAASCWFARAIFIKVHNVHGAIFVLPHISHGRIAHASTLHSAVHRIAGRCDASRLDLDSIICKTIAVTGKEQLDRSDQKESPLVVHLAPVVLRTCEQLLLALKPKFYAAKVLGLDAEWQPEGSGRTSKLAVLQLSIGSSALVLRLLHLPSMPPVLKELLEDPQLIKVGVGIHEDVKRLARDYDIHVKGAVELRSVAWKCDPNLLSAGSSMKALAASILGVQMLKNEQCSPWQKRNLTDSQVRYAAIDAWLPRAMLLQLLARQAANARSTAHKPSEGTNASAGAAVRDVECDDIMMDEQLLGCFDDEISLPQSDALAALIAGHVDHLPSGFKRSSAQASSRSKTTGDVSNMNGANKQPTKAGSDPSFDADGNPARSFKKSRLATRKSILYENCRLMAPDGTVLCTCARKKVQWYLERGLADIVAQDPMAIRLKFEPRGRGHADDQYYLSDKENRCCVCGHEGNYLRHNIVPHCYRQHFPRYMKSHLSHDIVLMCDVCHQRCGVHDQQRMRVLGREVGAPLEQDSHQYQLDKTLGHVRSAGRALITAQDKIPESRAEQLRDVIRAHFKVQELTPDIMEQASVLDIRTLNSDWASHAGTVVESLKDDEALCSFIYGWRTHFLKVMQPKFMPPFWSVESRVSNSSVQTTSADTQPDPAESTSDQ